MKTITINLYKFDELTEKAKQTAIDKYRNKHDNYFYYDETSPSCLRWKVDRYTEMHGEKR